MASLPVLTFPQHYVLIVHKQNIAVPTAQWRNTYEIFATVQPQPADPIVTAVQAAEQALLLNFAQIFAVELRNWTQGPQPFSQRPALWFSEVGPLIGDRNTNFPPPAGAEALGGEVVALIKRDLSTRHKASNLFLRYAVTTGDVDASPTGGYAFQGNAALTAIDISGEYNTNLAAFLGNAKDPGIVVVGVGNNHQGPPFNNPVTQFTCTGIAINKFKHKSHR